MYIDQNDIASFVFCPLLRHKGRHDIIIPKLTFIEEQRKLAFIEAERSACLKDNIVAPRKILSAWEKIWWPAVAETNISMKEAEKISIRAGAIFSDYCKYDISDWMFPTVGVEAESDVQLGNVILKGKADVVKVDLHQSKPTTVLINFTSRRLTLREASIDPAVKATAYSFYSGRKETIVHMLININEHLDKVKITTSTFYPKAMEEIRKMLYHVSCGIQAGNNYQNPQSCKECKLCQDFIL